MKKSIVLILASVIAAVAIAQQLTASQKEVVVVSSNPIFSWAETIYDFGEVKLNNPVTHTFTFTNTGRVPLVISSVKASCGCTVTEYSKEPIPSGGKGFVKATYNAATPGPFTKTVSIQANTLDNPVLLTIKGEVIK